MLRADNLSLVVAGVGIAQWRCVPPRTAYLPPNEHFTSTLGIGRALQSGDMAVGWIPLR